MFDNLPCGIRIGDASDLTAVVTKALRIEVDVGYSFGDSLFEMFAEVFPSVKLYAAEGRKSATSIPNRVWYAVFSTAEEAAEFKLRFI